MTKRSRGKDLASEMKHVATADTEKGTSDVILNTFTSWGNFFQIKRKIFVYLSKCLTKNVSTSTKNVSTSTKNVSTSRIMWIFNSSFSEVAVAVR